LFAALGRFAYRNRWVVLGTWALVLIAGAVFGGQLFDRLATVDNLRPDAESMRAEQRINELVDAGPVVFAVVAGVDPYSPSVVESVSQVSGEITKIPGVVDVADLYTGPGGLIGRDGQSTLVSVELSDTLPDDELARAEDEVRKRLASIAAPTVLVGGEHLARGLP
jgi:RND superfamily putative drug exporter